MTAPREMPTEEELFALQETFNTLHEGIQDITKAYIEFSMAYVAVFERIKTQEPDPNQLTLNL